MTSSRARSRAALAAAFAAVAAVSAAAAWTLGRQMQANWWCCEVPRSRNWSLSAQEILHLTHFYSQIGQDKWVLEAAFPGVRNGFFLDVGSADGLVNSNSKALEEHGWSGICVDPFPTHMQARTCRMFKEVVADQAGRQVKFRASGEVGGIDGTLGRWKDMAASGPLVEFTTVTLADILGRAGAPPVIQYVSIDVEGAELDVLRGFPFERYTIGILDVEHNYEEPKRAGIAALMEAHGYHLVRSWLQDDFYGRKAAGAKDP